jgi:hypothetical protein
MSVPLSQLGKRTCTNMAREQYVVRSMQHWHIVKIDADGKETVVGITDSDGTRRPKPPDLSTRRGTLCKVNATLRVMCGRRPHCKQNLTCSLRSNASHESGPFTRHNDLWPRCSPHIWSRSIARALSLVPQKRVIPIDGSTVSHYPKSPSPDHLSRTKIVLFAFDQAALGFQPYT